MSTYDNAKQKLSELYQSWKLKSVPMFLERDFPKIEPLEEVHYLADRKTFNKYSDGREEFSDYIDIMLDEVLKYLKNRRAISSIIAQGCGELFFNDYRKAVAVANEICNILEIPFGDLPRLYEQRLRSINAFGADDYLSYHTARNVLNNIEEYCWRCGYISIEKRFLNRRMKR